MRAAAEVQVTSDFERLRVRVADGVAFATLANPPLNLLTLALFGELARFAAEVERDPAVRVVVLRSDDPDFWIAHFDVEAILAFPTERPAERGKRVSDNPFHALCERFRTMPKATLAEIGGRVGGGGHELAMSCDMRFGALGGTVINQPEVALGILPGGTGTQRLPRLVGRGRALELILGCEDLDAATAERWGLLNRTLPPAELRPFVERLARRIASFPAAAVAAAKRAVLAAEPDPEAGLLDESFGFQQLLRRDEAQRAMRRFLERGGQTRAGEQRLGALCAELAD
jgi:enoyl-CoA hydratase/carnithine racemase